MKKLIFLFALLLVSILIFAQTNSKHVKVKGYYRSNGAYVKPHYRTAPNSTNRDNFSTLGNTNPYTNKSGWIEPDNHYSTNSSIDYSSSTSKKYTSGTSNSTVRTSIRNKGNLWKGPRPLDYIKPISKGDNVNVVGYERGYWKVIHNGTVGYIHDETIIVNAHMYSIKYPSNPPSDKKSYETNTTLKKYSSSSSSNSFSTNKYNSISSSNPVYPHKNLYDSNPKYHVTAYLNLRENSSESANVITQIPKGSIVKVINSNNRSWWMVYYNGIIGHVASRFLSKDNINSSNTNYRYTNKQTVESNGKYKIVDRTSFRVKPDSQSKVIYRFMIGDIVEVIDSSNKWWWEIKFNGHRGWVKSRLLKKN